MKKTTCESWQKIETAPEFETVLTQHIRDLYPVVAFKCGDTWFAETEGPEDLEIQGRYRLLSRNPTHWMTLPNSPQQ